MRAQPVVQIPAQRDAAPARVPGPQRGETLVHEGQIHGRQVLRHHVAQAVQLRLLEQRVELALDGLEPARLAQQVAPAVALHHADREHQQLELRRGRAKHVAVRRRFEQRPLERQAVDGGPEPTGQQLIVHVHVDEPPRGGVEPETALEPRHPRLERRRAAAEAELLEHGGKVRLGRALDQQVDVPLARHPAALFPVALPLAAVHHVAPLEGLAQRDDERARLALAWAAGALRRLSFEHGSSGEGDGHSASGREQARAVPRVPWVTSCHYVCWRSDSRWRHAAVATDLQQRGRPVAPQWHAPVPESPVPPPAGMNCHE